MSYRISEYPQDKYRFRIYDNVKRLTWKQIQAEQGADCVGGKSLRPSERNHDRRRVGSAT